MSDSVGFPICSVEIYPSNNLASSRPYVFNNSQLIQCTVENNLLDDNSGKFKIVLPPSGPQSLGYSYDWSDIISPMSLVVIGMQRGKYKNIVLIGVAVKITRDYKIQQSNKVSVGILIEGCGLDYYFTAFNYYTLGLLGGLGGTFLGESLGIGATANSAEILSTGFSNGTPKTIGQNFFETIMVGEGSGLLQKTYLYYKGGQQIQLAKLFNTAFQDYPTTSINPETGQYENVAVGNDFDYVTNEESWISKFRNIFPFPWYEFFVITAPANTYGPTGIDGNNYSAQEFTMDSIPGAKSCVTVVARPNPLPCLTVQASTSGQGKITGVNSTAWKDLTLYTANNFGMRDFFVTYQIGQTANYFAIFPVVASALYGSGNTQTSSWIYTQQTAVDPDSIKQFGYRPSVLSTVWGSDQSGAGAFQLANDFPQVSCDLIARIASTFGPQHLFLMGRVTVPGLRPDILPGNKFRFSPFKRQETFDFYIQAVEHNFEFGGNSTTTLTLSNGLPTTIYEGQSSPSLQDVLSGVVSRSGGIYVKDPSKLGVQFAGGSDSLLEIVQQISSGFSSLGGSTINPTP